MIELFRKYAEQYDFDYLLMAAQGYQESRLDQTKRSHVGAIGVMQVMPATARDKAVNIPDIEKLESNIHAGIKYNRWMIDNFYDDPGSTRSTGRSSPSPPTTPGPAGSRSCARRPPREGLDPEQLVQQRRAGRREAHRRETVTYVSNIYKYYVAYQMMAPAEARRAA